MRTRRTHVRRANVPRIGRLLFYCQNQYAPIEDITCTARRDTLVRAIVFGISLSGEFLSVLIEGRILDGKTGNEKDRDY